MSIVGIVHDICTLSTHKGNVHKAELVNTETYTVFYNIDILCTG